MKLLVVEDHNELAQSIKTFFTNENCVCELAPTFDMAQEKIMFFTYDCIVLDLMLPDGNGIDFLKMLRKQNNDTSVIIASAKNSLDFKLLGLDEGADDYMTKPFALPELYSRIKAILRRKNKNFETLTSFQEIVIDHQSLETSIHNIPIILTKKETNLLIFFIQNTNRVLSRQAIANHLWGDYTENLDNFDFVYQHVKNLRKKITDAGGEDYISTVYGLGYKFSEK
ncbi:MAG: response regulator transcription factor [Flavobacterium sp.]|nr:response regulator transcription factor [Candidatus Neoflavobacterium equi]